MSLLSKVVKTIAPSRLRAMAAACIEHLSLERERAASPRKLILFLVPRKEFFAGGILSIFYLYRLSRNMAAIHGGRVLMCSFPGEAISAFRYRKFKNNVLIYSFEAVLQDFDGVSEILLHIPEYAVKKILSELGSKKLCDLRSRYALKINILNQNILMMPDVSFIQWLKDICPDLTCTTAHPRYSTLEQRQYWGVPLHHLPAWFGPDGAPILPFETKRDLMLVAPDWHPNKEQILNKISKALPQLELRVIQNIPFEDYLKLERKAKWSLTFGEGMDAYFLGVFLRGGIGFAVYNEDFFTPEYQRMHTVYPSFSAMQSSIVEDIKLLDSKSAMEAYNSQVRPVIAGVWGPGKTKDALEGFYRGQFTYP